MNNSTATSGESIRKIPAAGIGSAVLLDVRTPAEYEEMHIEGSVLHPLTKLDPEEVKTLLGNTSECVVVCASGQRATRAAEQLQKALGGAVKLSVLDGGVKAWDAAGMPLVRGKGVISLERQVRIAAGSFVLIGVVLGFLVKPAWFALSGFVGAGLVFAGITDTCGMGMLLARMPWNNRRSQSACCVKGGRA